MITAEQRNKSWRERNASHIHLKTGGKYVLLGRGLLENNKTPVCIYQGVVTGQVWVRPAAEFDDGRFEQLVDKKGQADGDVEATA